MHPEEHPSEQPKEYRELPVADLSPKRKRSPLKWVVIVTVVIVAALVVWMVTGKDKKPAAKATTNQQAQTQTNVSPTHISSATKRYDSTNLFLGFEYPGDWVVNDASDKLTVTSPRLKLKTVGSTATDGRIVMTIQNPPASIPEFAKNTTVAPLASQKLTYKSPTPGQRAQTYLTSVNYSGSSSSIDAFYITSDNGYTAAQYIPQSDMLKINPLISLTFLACSDTACTAGKPTAIATNAWADSSLSRPLITMLQSLVLD